MFPTGTFNFALFSDQGMQNKIAVLNSYPGVSNNQYSLINGATLNINPLFHNSPALYTISFTPASVIPVGGII